MGQVADPSCLKPSTELQLLDGVTSSTQLIFSLYRLLPWQADYLGCAPIVACGAPDLDRLHRREQMGFSNDHPETSQIFWHPFLVAAIDCCREV